MARSLQSLVAEAVALGGGNLCASGHDMQIVGGRPCSHGLPNVCSQPVYQCERCEEYDYGEPGSLGYADCQLCDDFKARNPEGGARE